MSQSANDKYKILCFWDKHGLQATIDAFLVKKRTLYHWKARLKLGGKLALNDASKAPKSKRKRQWDKDIVDEIRYFRHTYPNLGKDKLYETVEFNEKMSDYLFWYNAKRPHYALGQISPIEYIKMNEEKYREKCNMLWTHTITMFRLHKSSKIYLQYAVY